MNVSTTGTGKKFLIVGATGQSAGVIIPTLLERGETVRCLVRNESKARALRDSGVDVVIGDLDHEATLVPAFEGIDTVFLVTAVGPNAERQGKNGVRAAASAGVGHVVRYSAIKFSDRANLRSARIDAAIEAELESSGMNITYIHSQSYMQNLMMQVPTIQSDSAMYVPYGEGKVGVMDLRDLGEVVIEVLTSEGHVGKNYSITGPRAISMHEVAEAISNAIGKKVAYVDAPPEAVEKSLLSFGMDPWIVDEYLRYFDAFKNNLANIVTNDYRKLMGREPRSIDDFSRDYSSVFSATG
ncbi:MAG: SDR family oxidoreductase [Chloroflexi bacterium]|nr:SDR family oxidoreductase [Chloroflexota bacterium]